MVQELMAEVMEVQIAVLLQQEVMEQLTQVEELVEVVLMSMVEVVVLV